MTMCGHCVPFCLARRATFGRQSRYPPSRRSMISPSRIPRPNTTSYNASRRWPRTASRNRCACSRVKGSIGERSTRGGSTSIATFRVTCPHFIAWFRAARRVDALPLWVLLGQHPPLNATHDNVQDGIDHLAHVQAPGASTWLCGRYQVFDTMPLTVGHICWVYLCLHTPSVPHLVERLPPFQTVSEKGTRQ